MKLTQLESQVPYQTLLQRLRNPPISQDSDPGAVGDFLRRVRTTQVESLERLMDDVVVSGDTSSKPSLQHGFRQARTVARTFIEDLTRQSKAFDLTNAAGNVSVASGDHVLADMLSLLAEASATPTRDRGALQPRFNDTLQRALASPLTLGSVLEPMVLTAGRVEWARSESIDRLAGLLAQRREDTSHDSTIDAWVRRLAREGGRKVRELVSDAPRQAR